MKKVIVVSFIFLSFFSCKDRKSSIDVDIITEERKNTDSEYICTLKENKGLVGVLKDFTFYDNSSFFVLSDNNLIEYTMDGEQKNVFNRLGRGPGEYVNPTLINTYRNSIYVWCSSTLKLIEFDKNGKSLREIKGYRRAIKNFKFITPDLICFYKSGIDKDAIIDIYSISENKVIKSVGELTEEALLLLALSFKPNMIIKDNNLYFTKPNELSIYQLNLDKFSLTKKINLEDKEFDIKEIQNAASIYNTDRQALIKYMTENSIVNNLLRIENIFCIKAEVGKYVLDFEKRETDASGRYDKYYLCEINSYDSEDKKSVYSVKIKKKGGATKYAIYDNKTYLLDESNTTEDERIKMFKLKL